MSHLSKYFFSYFKFNFFRNPNLNSVAVRIKFSIKLSDFIKFQEVYWHTLEEQGNIFNEVMKESKPSNEFYLSNNLFNMMTKDSGGQQNFTGK